MNDVHGVVCRGVIEMLLRPEADWLMYQPYPFDKLGTSWTVQRNAQALSVAGSSSSGGDPGKPACKLRQGTMCKYTLLLARVLGLDTVLEGPKGDSRCAAPCPSFPGTVL